MDKISPIFSHYTSKAINNFNSTFDRLTLQDYIRLIVIIGAYALLRPHLIKLGARFQAKDHERELDPEEIEQAGKISANSLRGESLKGKVHIPQDTDSESEDEARKTTDWGKKARRRQRKVIRGLLEEEDKRRRELEEDESDKEIQEFLVD